MPADPTEVDMRVGVPTLGRYRLCFEIGTGGMALVYLARTEGPGGFDKLVALKCIHPHLARDAGFVDMFLDEARLVSRLDHVNVCSVFDFGEVDGTYFMAMEYLMGQTLAGLSKKVWKDPEQSRSPRVAAYWARIIADACEGLHAAHELRGDDGAPLSVVHRDVSPGNLFITFDGHVRVMDFGIARATEQVHHTATGTTKGKVAYMAPEQMRNIDVDRRADIWSLGVVLWQLLTGKRLFRRQNDADTILAVLSDPIPKPSEARRGVPPALDRIALKALARNPAERYATAREMSKDLADLEGPSLGPVSTVELSEWMEALFAEEKARAQQLVRIARQLGGPIVPRVGPPPGDEGSESSAVSITLDDDEDVSTIAEQPRFAARRRGLGIAGVVAAAAIVVGGAFFAFRGSRTTATPHASAAPARGHVRSGSSAPPEAKPAHGPSGGAAASAPRRGTTDGTAAPQAEAAPTNGSAAGERAPLSEHAAGSGATATTETTADHRAGATTHGAPTVHAREHAAHRPATHPRPAHRPTAASSHPAAAAGPPGTVTVITPGAWADVYLGARLLGRTPDRFTLPPGAHELDLVPFGTGPRHRVHTTVTSGQNDRVIVRLQ